MLSYDCLAADATPAFLRSHFRRTDLAHPCLGLELGGCTSSTPAGVQGTASATGATVDEAEGAQPTVNRAEAMDNALFLLEEVGKGLGGDAFGELVGLPLLPLADGTLGRFLAADEEAVFVCTTAERRLLAGGGLGGKGGGAGQWLLQDLEELTSVARGLLGNTCIHAATNVAIMEPRYLAGMLDAVFPEAWKGLTQVEWTPEERNVSAPALYMQSGRHRRACRCRA